MKIFVPGDSAAVSVGADAVAAAVAATQPSATIIRNGSRGMMWLEPLVEIEIDSVRHAFGPVQPADVVAVLSAAMGECASSDLYLGATDTLLW